MRALDLLDRLVAVHERTHALDGSSPVATNPVRREGETEQSHIKLAPTFEYRRRDRHRGRREPVPGVGRRATPSQDENLLGEIGWAAQRARALAREKNGEGARETPAFNARRSWKPPGQTSPSALCVRA